MPGADATKEENSSFSYKLSVLYIVEEIRIDIISLLSQKTEAIFKKPTFY